jgi:hypothetical protein
MRKPRLEAFHTSKPYRHADAINTQGLVPMLPKSQGNTTVYPSEAQELNARKPEIGQLGNQASGQARLPESPLLDKPESLFARNLAECVQSALATKAAKKESFRFPEELIDVLEDLPYEIKKLYGKRVTKTAIFVAACTAYLWEFKKHGRESPFYQHLIESPKA